MQEKISLLAKKIKAAGKTVAFTGAGISTESGIPDYRSQGGIWEKFRPAAMTMGLSSSSDCPFTSALKKSMSCSIGWFDLVPPPGFG